MIKLQCRVGYVGTRDKIIRVIIVVVQHGLRQSAERRVRGSSLKLFF